MNLDELYKQYFNDLYAFLLSLTHDHHTTEDLLQETFFRAYLHLENYRDERVKTWLFTVARNTFIDYYRKQQRTVLKDEPFFKRLRTKQAGPLDDLILVEQIQEVIDDIKTLPIKQKQALLLRDFHDFPYKEGASIMNVSLSYFKILVYRARQTIRNRKADET